MLNKLPFNSVVLCDTEFEFGGVDGNILRPVCMVAKDLVTGQEGACGAASSAPPRPSQLSGRTLFVAYYASAEIGFFRALPANARAHP